MHTCTQRTQSGTQIGQILYITMFVWANFMHAQHIIKGKMEGGLTGRGEGVWVCGCVP